MPKQSKGTAFEQLLAEAERSSQLSGRAKDAAYVRLKRRLADMALPVSYEKAIQQLCHHLQY